MANADEVKKQLETRWEDWIRKAAPNVKQAGRNYTLGSPDGEAGASCKIWYSAKDGVHLWTDHATGETGNLIQLYARAQGVNWSEALQEARDFLGIHDVRPAKRIVKPKVTGAQCKELKIFDLEHKEEVRKYLEGRGISLATMQAYRIGSQEKGNGAWIAFPHIDTEGDIVRVKTMATYRIKGKKIYGGTKDEYPILWGWHTLDRNEPTLTIFEGEMDAMSGFEMGLKNSFSLPNGVSDLDWIENDYMRLRDFERINLCFDNEDVSDDSAAKVAARLGRERCFVVKVPGGKKDLNEFLQDSGDLNLMREAIAQAKTLDPPTIQAPEDVMQNAIRSRKEREALMNTRDFCLPIEFIQLPGEVTILEGYPGHGKSDLAYQMAVNDIAHGHRVMAVSFEIPSHDMFEAMAQNWAGRGASEDVMKEFLDAVSGSLWYIGDEATSLDFPSLCSDIEYAVRRFNVTRVLVDSLHFLVGKGDWEGQDKVILKLKRLAAELRNVHITLIAHAKFGEGGEKKIPGIDDVEGSKGMIKVAQNILSHWRNKWKEEVLRHETDEYDAAEYAKAREAPDAILKIHKQRNGFRKSFSTRLDYDFNARRFYLTSDRDKRNVAPKQRDYEF